MADQEDVFKAGRFHPVKLPIETNGSSTAPPKPLLVYHPTENGDYPVVLLFHGWNIPNSSYTQLMEHITSHGYITIAPRMYSIEFDANATAEIDNAVAISDWLLNGLSYYLPNEVRPDFEKVVISGHSRGGKVAFGLALGRTGKKTNLKLSAVVGLDPVDGGGRGHQSKPHILTYQPHSFDLRIPTLVIGSGLVSSCSPEGVNHRDFFNECSSPSYHFVASDFGHMSFVDDNPLGMAGNILCKGRLDWEPMRRFCGGLMVAFLNAFLRNDFEAFNDLFHNPSRAPVTLETPEQYIVLKSLTFMSKL